MSRIVFCKRYNEELKGLDSEPFEIALAKNIYNNSSEKAWFEWKKLQVIIINENRLDMSKDSDRKFLIQQMTEFLNIVKN